MRKFLGEILVDMEAATIPEVQAALQKQEDGDKRPIGEILIDGGTVSPENVARALAEQFDMRFVDLESVEFSPSVLQVVPDRLAKERKAIPLTLTGRVLAVAIADPLDLELVDTLRFTTGLQIEAVLASRRQIDSAVERHYGMNEGKLNKMMGEMTTDITTNITTDIKVRDTTTQDAEEDDALINRFVHQIIQSAYTNRASDIHIEPMEAHLRIRYRIDGVCLTMDPAPKRLQGPILQRLKIMADMPIEEKRKPLDGRIKIKLKEKVIDLRVSSLPSVWGESFVMRILDSGNLKRNLAEMGFAPDNLRIFESLIKRPNGIILVTGPTGSGKTTTLYATLLQLNTVDRKIITAEDPVEYNLQGINQCQVQGKIGLDFPRILRAMLRQAPNIVLVGEIRDKETAQIAIQASLTGHLVFSTLHTNDAASAVTRLIDMGVMPFLVATSIQAVLAQRLVRSVCPKCKTPYQPDHAELAALYKPEQLEGAEFLRGAGCDNCKGTGYRGRRGIHELMVMNRRLRELAFSKATSMEMKKEAINNGMMTLANDGAVKALQGLTTTEEVLAMAKADEG
jgi:type IV pilus assembly protein PilB